MQAIEIPDKADSEIRIFLKRESNYESQQDNGSISAKLDGIEKMFLQFTSIMQKGMQDVLEKMTNIQDLMVAIANNQQQEKNETSHDQRDVTHEEHLYHGSEVHEEEQNQQHEEVQMLEEEVEDDVEIGTTEEYIIDIDEERVEEDEVPVLAIPVKRRDSSSKPGPKSKKVKKEMISIQNYTDEDRMASEELLQIVESAAAIQSIQSSNVDSEEVINTSYSIKTENSLTDIKIQHDTKYEVIPVSEDLDFEFPLTSLDELKRLNESLTNDESIVEAMKHKLAEISTAMDYNFQKALQKLVADNVMHQLNWQGLKGKFRMKDMLIFSQILYQTWFQHIDFETYEELLKVITKKAHKRYSKTMERKRHRIQGGPARIVQAQANKKHVF